MPGVGLALPKMFGFWIPKRSNLAETRYVRIDVILFGVDIASRNLIPFCPGPVIKFQAIFYNIGDIIIGVAHIQENP